MLEFLQGDIFLTLIAIVLIELILGMDNLVVLFSLFKKKKVANKLLAIGVGFFFSAILRILILGTALTLLEKTFHLFSVSLPGLSAEVGSRGLVFSIAGSYLILHAILEIRDYFAEKDLKTTKGLLLSNWSWPYLILWIAAIDLVFSYDSLLGVLAVSRDFYLLAIGLIISRTIMLFFFVKIYRFIKDHPELMVVMFIFLAMVGLGLALEGLEDMQTVIVGVSIRSFPVSWLYSIFAIGVIYSWWHTRNKKRKSQLETSNND